MNTNPNKNQTNEKEGKLLCKYCNTPLELDDTDIFGQTKSYWYSCPNEQCQSSAFEEYKYNKLWERSYHEYATDNEYIEVSKGKKVTQTTNSQGKEVNDMPKTPAQSNPLEKLATKLAISNNNYVKYAKDKAEAENRPCYLSFISKVQAQQALQSLVAISYAKKDLDTLDHIQELIKAYSAIETYEADIIRKIKALISLDK